MHRSVPASVVKAFTVEGFMALALQFYILELFLNASAQPFRAPPLPLIVCDL